MKCKKHRGYKAVRRPRTACEACWRMYIEKYPTELMWEPLIKTDCFWIPKPKSKYRWKIGVSKDAPWH